MESGSELSKTVATFILQKILLDETGLSYICQTFERFSHVSTVLVSYHAPPLFRVLTSPTPLLDYYLPPPQAKMVQSLAKEPSTRLLKHVVRCYLRLSDNLRSVGSPWSCSQTPRS